MTDAGHLKYIFIPVTRGKLKIKVCRGHAEVSNPRGRKVVWSFHTFFGVIVGSLILNAGI